jgi:hypothetical protein
VPEQAEHLIELIGKQHPPGGSGLATRWQATQSEAEPRMRAQQHPNGGKTRAGRDWALPDRRPLWLVIVPRLARVAAEA